MFFGNSFMATTKSAHTFTKGEMDINTYALFPRLVKALPYTFLPFFTGETIPIPVRDSWIAGITRAWNIIFAR